VTTDSHGLHLSRIVSLREVDVRARSTGSRIRCSLRLRFGTASGALGLTFVSHTPPRTAETRSGDTDSSAWP